MGNFIVKTAKATATRAAQRVARAVAEWALNIIAARAGPAAAAAAEEVVVATVANYIAGTGSNDAKLAQEELAKAFAGAMPAGLALSLAVELPRRAASSMAQLALADCGAIAAAAQHVENDANCSGSAHKAEAVADSLAAESSSVSTSASPSSFLLEEEEEENDSKKSPPRYLQPTLSSSARSRSRSVADAQPLTSPSPRKTSLGKALATPTTSGAQYTAARALSRQHTKEQRQILASRVQPTSTPPRKSRCFSEAQAASTFGTHTAERADERQKQKEKRAEEMEVPDFLLAEAQVMNECIYEERRRKRAGKKSPTRTSFMRATATSLRRVRAAASDAVASGGSTAHSTPGQAVTALVPGWRSTERVGRRLLDKVAEASTASAKKRLRAADAHEKKMQRLQVLAKRAAKRCSSPLNFMTPTNASLLRQLNAVACC